MNKIPNNIKYIVYGISGLFFLALNFGLGLNIHVGLTELLQNITDYFFGFSSNTIDYLIIASVPIIGMLLNSKRKKFILSELVMDIFVIIFWVLIMFGIGLYSLTIIGKPTNPLMPDYLIIEPFYLYTTSTIVIGVLIPFLFVNRTKKEDQIENIGTE